MQPSEDLIIEFENHFLRQLIHLLEKHKITVEKAKEATESYLTSYPFNSEEDMKNKLKEFCLHYPEFQTVETLFKKYDEQKKMNNLLTMMRSHLKDNNLGEVLKLAQQ